jgi:hypothetical protein
VQVQTFVPQGAIERLDKALETDGPDLSRSFGATNPTLPAPSVLANKLDHAVASLAIRSQAPISLVRLPQTDAESSELRR